MDLIERKAEYGLAWRAEGVKVSRVVFGGVRKTQWGP